MKLKKWVKVLLVSSLVLVIAIVSNNEYHKAIDSCTSSGNSYQFCVETLK